MLVIGRGGKSATLRIFNVGTAVLRYRYFHLMWLFQIAYGLRYTWLLPSPTGAYERPITEQEMQQYHIAEQLRVKWWWHWGLLALLVVLVGFALVMALVSATGALG